MEGELATPRISAPRRPYLRMLFVVLPLFLLFQLKLRTNTEPYPAILLPAGAGLLKSEDSFTGFVTECSAEDAAGRLHPFSVGAVLVGVPTNYRQFVVDGGFGIDRNRVVRSLPIPGIGRRLYLGRQKTPSQVEVTRQWLREKLRKTIGIDAVRIHVFKYAVTTYYGSASTRQARQL